VWAGEARRGEGLAGDGESRAAPSPSPLAAPARRPPCAHPTLPPTPPPNQVRTIRRKMMEIMAREASSCDLKDLVAKFIPEAIGKDIEKVGVGGLGGGGWGVALKALPLPRARGLRVCPSVAASNA
jgi:hypothetical protein